MNRLLSFNPEPFETDLELEIPVAQTRLGQPDKLVGQGADSIATEVNAGRIAAIQQIAHKPGIMRQTPPVTKPGSPGFRGARATAGEQGMAFAGYRAEEGWVFLQGPGGQAGHAWNQPGFDGIAFKITGPLEIHILDNKSLAKPGTVSSATALSQKLLKNLDDLIDTASQARFNDVSRIAQVRASLQAARTAVAAGRPLPSRVKLVVTNFGGRSTRLTSRLATQGIIFRDLMASTTARPLTRAPTVSKPMPLKRREQEQRIAFVATPPGGAIYPPPGLAVPVGLREREQAEIQRVRGPAAHAAALPAKATLRALQFALNNAASTAQAERKGLRAVASLAPQCVNSKHIISGFPEYAVTPEMLGAEQQALLRRITSEIAASFNTDKPIVAILAVGHADVALRKPVVERDAFERTISQQRADNALRLIITDVQRLAGATGKDFIAGMQTRAIGVGSTQRLVPSPKTEFEMRLNRRVEVLLAQCVLPSPPISDSLERRIARLLELLKTRRVDPDPTGKRTDRARCVLTKLMKPGILDMFVDGTASNQQVGKHFVRGNLCSWHGNYDPPPLSDADLLKFLGTVSSIIKGAGFAPTVSDEQVLKGLSQLIFMINEGIVRVERYITLNSDFGYSGDKTRGTRLSSIFADHLNDDNSIYSCYKDFHGGE